MTENELIILQDKGLVSMVFKNGRGQICIVLKICIPTEQLIAYISCINGADEYHDVLHTMENGMKLSRAEALGFFPEHAVHIVKHYKID